MTSANVLTGRLITFEWHVSDLQSREPCRDEEEAMANLMRASRWLKTMVGLELNKKMWKSYCGALTASKFLTSSAED